MIPKLFIEAIKNQAMNSEDEIYGWLIGYLKDKIPNVLAIIECRRFTHQSYIAAIPDVQSFQEVSSAMPQGIGPIGIYHSHPHGGKVFHSHTDDTTLLSLSKQFPSSISIVTNGSEINFYQMDKNRLTEIQVEFMEVPIPALITFTMREKIPITLIGKPKDSENVKIKILNQMRTFFEEIWDLITFQSNGKTLTGDMPISDFLSSNLSEKPIELKIPIQVKEKFKENLEISLSKLDTGGKVSLKKKINLNLTFKIPYYAKNSEATFKAIKEIMRVEIISNNIIQRLYMSIFKLEQEILVIPKEFYLEYFGIFLRILAFDDKTLNKKLSDKVYAFLFELLISLKTFINSDLTSRYQNFISAFLEDVKELSTQFPWDKKIKKLMNSLEKKLR